MICASLLGGAWFCQSEIQCLVICCRMKRVRSDFVGSFLELIRGRFVAALAAESTTYFVAWNTSMARDPDQVYRLGER